MTGSASWDELSRMILNDGALQDVINYLLAPNREKVMC